MLIAILTYAHTLLLHTDNATRGSKIVVTLKEGCKEFAKPARVKEIIKKYSNFVNFPIKVVWFWARGSEGRVGWRDGGMGMIL